MRADNSRHLHRRGPAPHAGHPPTRRRRPAAHRHRRHAVTFDAVARKPGVSRSWLYTQPDLRAEIERLRDRHRPAPATAVPDRQRASDASLLRRLEAATQRIRATGDDNQRLRDALAQALGERRAAAASRTTTRHAGTTSFRRHRTLLNSHVNDTVHIANQQLTAMIISTAQDNDRAAEQGGETPHRRGRSVPEPEALLRLAGAVLVEAHDEWQATDRRYLGETTMALLTSPPPDEQVATPELMTA